MGNVADQVKFSELTLDMFRMLQTLEREPQDEMNQVCAITTSRTAKSCNNKVPLNTFFVQVYDTSPAPGRLPMMENGGVGGRRENPHKCEQDDGD